MILLLLAALLVSASESFAETDTLPADSLIYAQTKQQIIRSDSAGAAQFIAAADELAALGLYKQALQLIHSLAGESAPSQSSDKKAASSDSSIKALTCRIRAGGDYIDFNDPETQRNKEEVIDPHALDNRRAYVSAALSWQPFAHKDIALLPKLEIANEDASGALGVSFRALNSMLLCDFEGGAKKRFWHEDYDTVVTPRGDKSLQVTEKEFAGNEKEDSDFLFGSIAVNLTNRQRHQQVIASLPVRIDGEKYREDRTPYISFIQYSLVPQVEYTTSDYTKSLLFLCEANYYDYSAIPVAAAKKDTADRVLVRPELSFNAWQKAYSFEARTSYMYEHYRNAQYPQNWSIVQAYTKGRLKLLKKVVPSAAIEYRHENSKRKKTVAWQQIAAVNETKEMHPVYGLITKYDTVFIQQSGDLSYAVHGDYLKLSPEIEISPHKLFSFRIGMRYEDCWHEDFLKTVHMEYEATDTTVWQDYLAESLRSLEPQIGLELEHTRFAIAATGSYRYTTSKNEGKYDYDRRDSWRLNLDAHGSITKWLSLYALADYEQSWYDSQSEPQQNMSLSGGVSLKF